jgi:hypothetical protein
MRDAARLVLIGLPSRRQATQKSRRRHQLLDFHH